MRTQQLSDLTVNPGPAQVVARKHVYSDLDLTLIPNPISGDINPIKDIEAIKKSVMNLILTNFTERPFQPEVASNVRGLLFEPADPITISDIEDECQKCLENFEPRIRVINVTASDRSDMNAYDVVIEFQILANEQVARITTLLERLR